MTLHICKKDIDKCYYWIQSKHRTLRSAHLKINEETFYWKVWRAACKSAKKFFWQKRNTCKNTSLLIWHLQFAHYQKGQTISKEIMILSIVLKNERNSLSWVKKILRIVSFVFWKNWGHHKLLLRFTDLYLSRFCQSLPKNWYFLCTYEL